MTLGTYDTTDTDNHALTLLKIIKTFFIPFKANNHSVRGKSRMLKAYLAHSE